MSKHDSASGPDAADDLIVLRDIRIVKDSVVLHFDQDNFYAWFENSNKHIPEIYELERMGSGFYRFDCGLLPDLFTQTYLKLSLGNDSKRLEYSMQGHLSVCVESESAEFVLKEERGILLCFVKNKSQLLWSEKIDSLNGLHRSGGFENSRIESSPKKICVIGTCFSRSVFRSDEYFNPDYKRFFTVPLTLFHNSLISLMSKRFEETGYCWDNDLLGDHVFRYVEVEFLKDLKERLCSSGADYLVIDNYSDATLEAVEIGEGCFFTYNKYFSESIFKRRFSGKKILVPGELKHIDKYREATKRLFLLLQELNLDKRVILVGGRLSAFKTRSELWQSKMSWIKRTNQNWDAYDAIFLEEFPDAQYIDMRSTAWISDVNPPIVGGASPSHYQSGFYKEIYRKIMCLIFKEIS
ncbi:DUF6270 domain-containing protein [Pseudomonas sp. 148P]|uniref:DUF6270 domain-containing protein n=1 Tax=Pseudomonas ulcerans TaxID=3115852 RepID=A0ABU7HJG2_9PSED|nr:MULTISPECIES: DUF6270 domain-containing protein [unclassified Pseudomonas]MEE1921389.1 DUF6270 domain-containing protein [Pseudomonas sp. 147P]MEE1931672.1 DUF6270 domain-containing protein [Pseudomonas sp. 148P]